jgi:hypothetical protein
MKRGKKPSRFKVTTTATAIPPGTYTFEFKKNGKIKIVGFQPPRRTKR